MFHLEFDRVEFYPGIGYGPRNQTNSFGKNSPNGACDEIRFGESFSDVTPGARIPEK